MQDDRRNILENELCGIWVLLILAFVIGRIQSKKRYEKMMSSVMETNGDDYKTGNGENTCVWKNVTDAAVVRGYWKDCLKAKFNLWNIIKVLLVVVGIMLVLPYRKTSGSMLGLRGKAQHEIKERSGKKLFCNRRDETENKEFNRLFHIISQDDENLFYMLTPATMEKLIALYKTFSGCSERLHVCFKEDKLYIGVPLWNYMNYKPATSGTSGLKKIQKSLWNDLCMVKAVLDLALTL